MSHGSCGSRVTKCDPLSALLVGVRVAIDKVEVVYCVGAL